MRISDWRSDVCSSDRRRFIAPQRQAVERLAQTDFPWLEPADHIHLREAAERCARMAEELEAVRERAELAHEELTAIGREHVCNPVTNAHIVCRLLLEKQNRSQRTVSHIVTVSLCAHISV